jgi:hypothetical protein
VAASVICAADSDAARAALAHLAERDFLLALHGLLKRGERVSASRYGLLLASGVGATAGF